MYRSKVEIGKTVNRWTVEKELPPNKHNQTMALCKCECGNLRSLIYSVVVNGHSKGCHSCSKLDIVRKPKSSTPKKQSSEYNSWLYIKGCCHNPNHIKYPRFGGLGIKVYEEWKNSFKKFIDDMGHRPSPRHILTRVDKSKDFEPKNLIWLEIPPKPSVSTQHKSLLKRISRVLKTLKSEQRKELFDEITNGYCKACGCDDPYCPCENDE
jgi:hypothetical protein